MLCFCSLDLFLNLCCLTNAVANVVELSTSNLTGANYLNLLNVGRMYRERLLDTATVSYASDSKRLGNSAAVLSDDSTLEDLYSFSCSLFDLVVNLNGITDVKSRNVFL